MRSYIPFFKKIIGIGILTTMFCNAYFLLALLRTDVFNAMLFNGSIDNAFEVIFVWSCWFTILYLILLMIERRSVNILEEEPENGDVNESRD